MYRHKTSVFINLLLATTVTVVSGCIDPSIEDELDEKPIRLMVSREFDMTRAVTTDVQGAVFDAGEKINVWITGQSDDVSSSTIGDSPNVYTTGTAEFGSNPLIIDADKQPYYHYGNNSKATIYAAYPANSDVNVTPAMTTFTVQSDQRTVQAYKNSDLMMMAPNDYVKSSSVVSLPFKHKMVKLIVTAIADDGVTVDNELLISGVKRKVDINVAAGDLARPLHVFDDTDGSQTEKPEIQILNGGALLFPPQQVSAIKFIRVTGTKDGIQRTAVFNIVEKVFEEGRVYKLNLHIGRDNFNVNEDNEPVETTITGWSSDFDELTLQPSAGYKGVQIGDIDGRVQEVDQTATLADLKNGNYIHNGTPRCPRPVVTYGTENPVRLIEGADFRFAYVDNVNCGTALAMVIGQGSYAGLAAMKEFTIERAVGKISFPDGSDKTGEKAVAFSPEENIGATVVNNTGDGEVRYSIIADGDGESASCATVDAVDGTIILQNQGKCTVKAVATSGRNYDYPEPNDVATYKIQIMPREVKVGNLTITYEPLAFTYDGTAKKLTKLVVADGEHTLAENVDYTYTLTDSAGRYEGLPIHHGTALLTVKGKGNYSASTNIKVSIPVNQAKPTIDIKTTQLALGKYEASAPKDRRKKREATTDDWAVGSVRYSLSATADVTENTYLRVGKNNGMLTGLKVHPSDATTTVYVCVDADNSAYHDWVASEQMSFDVKVYESDFTFKIKRYAYDDYREPQLHILADGTPEGAHTRWVCPAKGEWQIDCYGAQGGTTPTYTNERLNHYRTSETYGPRIVADNVYSNKGVGGRGAHIAGRINLPKGQVLHVNLGQKGRVIYPGEQRLRGIATEICTVVEEATAKAASRSYKPNANKVNRGHNGGKVNGDVGYLKAGDYEWAAFAWNGGGGLVWGAHNMENGPRYYNQDNYFLGNNYNASKSPVALGSYTNDKGAGTSYAMFPVTGGGGATDVSLAWDEEGGVYTPPTGYTDADRTDKTSYTYIDNSSTDGKVTLTYAADATPIYTRAVTGTFEKWMTAHNMANREYGVGVQGDGSHMVGLQWKNPAHLYSRIIVAGGGGGALYYDNNNVYGDGGDGGVWEGTRGLFQDYGEGGYINAAGRGGIWQNWKMGKQNRSDYRVSEYELSTMTSDNTDDRGDDRGTNYPSDIVYNDGPNGGGWSGTDGMFGEGGNHFQPTQGCGGGGGGWYGGGSGCEDGSNGPGGGGSSYMWTDKESVRTYLSSSSTGRSNFGINHNVTWGTSKLLYKFYDSLDDDYEAYNGFKPERWHKKAANFYQFMPTNETVRSEATGYRKTKGIECPFFHEIVTKDTGTNAGDGWAKITLVEIDDEQ